jgi:hypothetical protein
MPLEMVVPSVTRVDRGDLGLHIRSGRASAPMPRTWKEKYGYVVGIGTSRIGKPP